MPVAEMKTENPTDDWTIPLWLKYMWTVFSLGSLMVLIRSLSASKGIFQLSTAILVKASLVLFVFSGILQIVFWVFPNGRIARLIYFLLRLFRIPICLFSLLGIVYIIVIRAPLFSLRGAGSVIVLVSLIFLTILLKPIVPSQLPYSSIQRLFEKIAAGKTKINAVPRWILCIVVSVLPVLIACCFVYFGLHSNFSIYRPYSSWNDETGYWLWNRSFSQVGLNVGYNAPNEMIPRAGFNHYGEDSPLYVYFYGIIAKFVGWSPALPLFINFVILSIAIFSFTYFTRFDSLQIIMAGLVAVITWPIPLYLLMTSHETINQAIGFGISGIFLILLTHKNRVNWVARVSFVVFIYFATLLRLSWGLMLIPVIFYILDGKLLRRGLGSILLGFGLFISAVLITGYLVPPVNNSIFLNVRNSVTHGPQILLIYMWGQLGAIFGSGLNNPNLAIVFQMLVIIGWNLVRLARQIRLRVSIEAILMSLIVFDLYNMIMLLLAGLMFYLNWAFFRTLTPSVLVISLLKVAKKDFKFVSAILLINLVFFSSYMSSQNLQIIKSDFTQGYANMKFVQATIEKDIIYDPLAINPWCNTLLIPVNYYDYRLIVIPPGIGISYILDTQAIQIPIKSRYLLLDRDTYKALSSALRVELLDSLPIGDLYLNLDAKCDVR
jgi:hypothetical protein